MSEKKGIIDLNEIDIIEFPIENEKISDSKKSTKEKLNHTSPNKREIFSPPNKKNKENENDSISDINFINKPEKQTNKSVNNVYVEDTSENVFVKNIVNHNKNNNNQNEDIYLETSCHNPFTMSINSNNINLISGINFNGNTSNNNFKKFMKAKKNEIENNDFTSEREFALTTANQKVLLKMFDVSSLEEENRNNTNNDFYNKEKGIEVLVKINNSSITAFNVNTNFSVISGEYFPLMHLNFNSVSASLFINVAKLTCKICVLASEKAFLFQFSGKSYFEFFTQILNQIINNSLGSKTNLHAVTLRKDYYKVLIIIH